MKKKLRLEDATDEEIITELNQRLKMDCSNCNGWGYTVENRGRTNERKESCSICGGNGNSIDFKRALKLKHLIGHIN